MKVKSVKQKFQISKSASCVRIDKKNNSWVWVGGRIWKKKHQNMCQEPYPETLLSFHLFFVIFSWN